MQERAAFECHPSVLPDIIILFILSILFGSGSSGLGAHRNLGFRKAERKRGQGIIAQHRAKTRFAEAVLTQGVKHRRLDDLLSPPKSAVSQADEILPVPAEDPD
jgi:hypothetical protein